MPPLPTKSTTSVIGKPLSQPIRQNHYALQEKNTIPARPKLTPQERYHFCDESDATQISFKDLSFPASRFHLYSGIFRYTQERLSAGGSLNLTAVVTPKRSGYLFVTPASVSYVDEAGESHVTRLAADETVGVEDILVYRRRTDRHRQEWGAYGVAFVLLVMGPMGMSLVVQRGLVDGGKKKVQ